MLNNMKIPNNVVAIELEGVISEDDIATYQRKLEDTLKSQSTLGLCMDITDISDITASGIVEGVKADLAFLSNIDRFNKLAIISDKQWPEAISSIVAPYVSGITIKTFSPDERQQALDWASADHTQSEEGDNVGVRILNTDKDNVFAFEFVGKLTADNIQPVIDKVQAFLEKHERVDMVAYLNHFHGFSPSIFMQSGLFGMKMSAMDKLDKYAIIGAPKWIAKAVEVCNPMFPSSDIRSFTQQDEGEALQWIGTNVERS
ncbi:STAS/SEC14 domain-containing protein [Alteromonas genovensis]|uniref:STAS/SEC14 domain-containing protein n=1 Tax=Alteromonas genovensis TaxID=471225 RepID=UPI002FDFC70C